MSERHDAPAALDLAEDSVVHRFSHEAMATTFEVRAVHADGAYARQAAHAGFELVDRLEQELSRFVPNSDIARINDLSAGKDTRVSPDTMECLVIARHLHTLTDGAFDVSIGSGLDRLELELEELHVRGDGVRLDLGGIGKGYAVDRLAAVLEEWGLDRALVHGGWSSVLALEPPPEQDGWPLTLSTPGPGVTRLLARLSARQLALSASGTRKGSHILDPRTGQGVAKGAIWVSLPRSREQGHSTAAVAEGLSTAFMVLPREKIEELCLRNTGLEAWLLVEPSPGEQAVVHLGAR